MWSCRLKAKLSYNPIIWGGCFRVKRKYFCYNPSPFPPNFCDFCLYNRLAPVKIETTWQNLMFKNHYFQVPITLGKAGLINAKNGIWMKAEARWKMITDLKKIQRYMILSYIYHVLIGTQYCLRLPHRNDAKIVTSGHFGLWFSQ